MRTSPLLCLKRDFTGNHICWGFECSDIEKAVWGFPKSTGFWIGNRDSDLLMVMNYMGISNFQVEVDAMVMT